jgi:hypothetical protein
MSDRSLSYSVDPPDEEEVLGAQRCAARQYAEGKISMDDLRVVLEALGIRYAVPATRTWRRGYW